MSAILSGLKMWSVLGWVIEAFGDHLFALPHQGCMCQPHVSEEHDSHQSPFAFVGEILTLVAAGGDQSLLLLLGNCGLFPYHVHLAHVAV